MFFGDDPKKIATIIASKRPPGGGPKLMHNIPMKPEKVMNEGGEVDGRHIAAQEMMGAMHEKSPQKLMEALSNFIDIHHSKNSTVDKD